MYLDHTRAAEIEHQQGVDEMNRKHEGESIDASALQALVRQAVALNRSGQSKASRKAKH